MLATAQDCLFSDISLEEHGLDLHFADTVIAVSPKNKQLEQKKYFNELDISQDSIANNYLTGEEFSEDSGKLRDRSSWRYRSQSRGCSESLRKERDSNMSGSETGSEDQGRPARGGGPAGGMLYSQFATNHFQTKQ